MTNELCESCERKRKLTRFGVCRECFVMLGYHETDLTADEIEDLALSIFSVSLPLIEYINNPDEVDGLYGEGFLVRLMIHKINSDQLQQIEATIEAMFQLLSVGKRKQILKTHLNETQNTINKIKGAQGMLPFSSKEEQAILDAIDE